MVKLQPQEAPEPPTKYDFFEHLYQKWGLQYWYFPAADGPPSMDFLYDYVDDYFISVVPGVLENFQSEKLLPFGVLTQYFQGDWRMGREIRKVVITQRFYQISPNSTQA